MRFSVSVLAVEALFSNDAEVYNALQATESR
jgi:hypothetical protein